MTSPAETPAPTLPVGTLPDELRALLEKWRTAVWENATDCATLEPSWDLAFCQRREDAARACLDAALLPYVRDAERWRTVRTGCVLVQSPLAGALAQWTLSVVGGSTQGATPESAADAAAARRAARSSTPGGDRA